VTYEVPAEAEHVHPPADAAQPRALAEAQDRVGHPDELLGHAPLTPPFGVAVAGGDLLVACSCRSSDRFASPSSASSTS
jgi:hypothetical protein